MARLSAELGSFHVLDGTVGELSPDNDINERGNRKKPSQFPESCLAIKFRGSDTGLQAPFSQIDADGDQEQTDKK